MASVFGNLRWSRCGKSDAAKTLYKAQLCSSCHAMHSFSGRTTSLLANYDQSLLVLVLSSVAGGALEQRRCTAIPWRMVAVQDLPVPLRRYVAAGNLALIDAKLRDDQDDGSRWYAGIARLLLRRKTRKALRELGRSGFATALVAGLPVRQQAIEQAAVRDPRTARLASLAEPSAELLAAVFAHGGRLAGAEHLAPILARFGHAVARAVYGFDALDDHDEDRASGAFNAVAMLAQRVGHEAAVEAVRQFVEHAAIEAQQCATQLLPADRQIIVAAVLQQLTQRALACRDQLLGRPAAAAMRPAEAGDCDCACDGCDCGSGDCGSCDGGCCPCDCWCFDGGGSKRKASEAAQAESVDDVPMR